MTLTARTSTFVSPVGTTAAVPESRVVLLVSIGARFTWSGAHTEATMAVTSRNAPSPTRIQLTIFRTDFPPKETK